MLCCCFVLPLMAFSKTHVFVSFSMPESLLEETLKDAAKKGIPATLNGLYQDSMQKTAEQIMRLSKQVPNAQLQIDPTLFERFNIHQVPALVVENDGCFDVIYGHLPIDEGLFRISRKGDCAREANR